MFPVGIDVSKNTLDLCMLYDGIKGRIKTRNIQNNRHSVENGVLRRNRRNFRYPNFSPATSVSKSIISLLLWKV